MPGWRGYEHREVLTLLYHNVVANPVREWPVARSQVTLDAFSRHVERFRGQILHPFDVHESLQRGKNPRGVLFTFDDGAAGVAQAAEILAGHGAAGITFVCPGAVMHGLWFYRLADALVRATVPQLTWGMLALPLQDDSSRRAAYRELSKSLFQLPPSDRDAALACILEELKPTGEVPAELSTLREPDLRSIAASGGMIFGNHSWSHPDLSRLSGEELTREVEAAQSWLDTSGLPVLPWFAFPRGIHSTRVREIVRRSCPLSFGTYSSEKTGGVLPRTYLSRSDGNALRFHLKTGCNGRVFRLYERLRGRGAVPL